MAKAKKKSLPKKKASTALAVRPKKAPVGTVTISGMPGPEGLPLTIGQLGELSTVGALGLAEVKLTADEEAVLARPVDIAQVLIKPDGAPYLSHPSYTKWFGEAFGRLGWAIVPASKPQRAERLVVIPHLLYIHGRPVAYAIGEQDYYEGNKRQTWGDAAEATVASALRRCAKRLGVGLELWDKAWIRKFREDHCVAVTVQKRSGERETQWRLKGDPELPGEVTGGRRRSGNLEYQEGGDWQPEPIPEELRSAVPSGQPETITAKQLGRLKEIVERVGRQPEEVSLYLKKNFNVARASKLLQKDYAKVCRDLEARGDLPMPGDGQ